MNSIILTGRIANTSGERMLNGRPLVTFTLITKSKNNFDRHHIAAWDGAARVARLFRDGDYAHIEGHIQYRDITLPSGEVVKDPQICARTLYSMKPVEDEREANGG